MRCIGASDSKIGSDGVIELTYFLDTGKRRWTPTEFADWKAAITKLARGNMQMVEFTSKATDLVALGKTSEALRLVREEALSHPQNVQAQLRYAQLLTNSGAEDAALAAAQKAIALEPKSVLAWIMLAVLYERDSFGRLRTGNWKPEEAEKALRKALELDQENVTALMELAILLEFDNRGQRYGKDARIAEAIALYRRILAKNTSPAISQNLVIALIHMGKYKEAQEELRNLASGNDSPVLAMVVEALTDGADRAIIDSQNSTVESSVRSNNLAEAAMTLNQLRRYEVALDLLKAAQRITDSRQFTQQLETLRKTNRYDEILAPEDDPKRPVQELLTLIGSGSATDASLASLLSKQADLARWRSSLQHASQAFAGMRGMMRTNGVSNDMISDLLVSTSNLSVKGTGNPAYAVELVTQLHTNLAVVYVVRENSKCRLLAPNDGLEIVGTLANQELSKGNLAAAQAWLDVVKDRAIPITVHDDKGPAFRYLWAGTAPETRTAAFVRAAAASLMGTYGGSDEAIRILRASADRPAQYMDREDVNFAICEALKRAGKWLELIAASQPLFKSHMFKEVAYRFIAEARIHLRQWNDLEREADSRLRASGKDYDATLYRAVALMQRGKFDDARQAIQNAQAFPRSHGDPEINLAEWSDILAGKMSDA